MTWAWWYRPLPLALAGVGVALVVACLVCGVAGTALWQLGIRPGTERYRFEGPAMEPTIREGQIIVAQRYGTAAPVRGDIVVFHPPAIPKLTLTARFVMRIVALPGDTIAFTNSALLLNGKPLLEPYVAPENADYAVDPRYRRLTLPAAQYFVLGDNRRDSLDSRTFGPIARSAILEKAVSVV